MLGHLIDEMSSAELEALQRKSHVLFGWHFSHSLLATLPSLSDNDPMPGLSSATESRGSPRLRHGDVSKRLMWGGFLESTFHGGSPARGRERPLDR